MSRYGTTRAVAQRSTRRSLTCAGCRYIGRIHGIRRLAEREQQVADVAVAGQVAAVGERVLGDEDRLLDAARGEALDLAHDVASARLRCRPRNCGIAQKVQPMSQPSAIFTYA